MEGAFSFSCSFGFVFFFGLQSSWKKGFGILPSLFRHASCKFLYSIVQVLWTKMTPSLGHYRQTSSRPRPTVLLRGADQGSDWSSDRERYAVCPLFDVIPALDHHYKPAWAVVRGRYGKEMHLNVTWAKKKKRQQRKKYYSPRPSIFPPFSTSFNPTVRPTMDPSYHALEEAAMAMTRYGWPTFGMVSTSKTSRIPGW